MSNLTTSTSLIIRLFCNCSLDAYYEERGLYRFVVCFVDNLVDSYKGVFVQTKVTDRLRLNVYAIKVRPISVEL